MLASPLSVLFDPLLFSEGFSVKGSRIQMMVIQIMMFIFVRINDVFLLPVEKFDAVSSVELEIFPSVHVVEYLGIIVVMSCMTSA